VGHGTDTQISVFRYFCIALFFGSRFLSTRCHAENELMTKPQKCALEVVKRPITKNTKNPKQNQPTQCQ